MYYFNYKLIERLPYLLGKLNKEVVKALGVTNPTYQKWCNGEISCQSLVHLCNVFRISISSFLVIKESPEQMDRASDYVYPEESWTPVVWDNVPLGQLFGHDGMTGVSCTEAADKLGIASYQIFARWGETPSAIRMRDMMNLLNTFKIDAGLFFKDENLPVPVPTWAMEGGASAGIPDVRLSEYAKLLKRLNEADRENKYLRGERDRLNREILLLRAKKEDRKVAPVRMGMVSESSTNTYNPFQDRGYVFHEQLWESLPEMFDMSKRDFCAAVGIGYQSSYHYKNLLVSTVIKACNMFRMSISHFFLPKSEVPVVHDKGFYVMSKQMFMPIEDCMDRLRYLFGRYSAAEFTMDDLKKQGVGYGGLTGMAQAGGTARVFSLCEICTTFNIPPYIFFNDSNRRKAVYSQSLNERLLLNAIEMTKDLENYRAICKEQKERQESEEKNG